MSAEKIQEQIVRPKSGKTCTVGCKLPNGLHLDIKEQLGQPVQRVTVRGTNAGAIIEGQPLFPGKIAVGGYGITNNVPEEFFDHWLRINAALPVVKNGLIFKDAKEASVIDMAKEMAGEKNRLEPIDQKNPGKGFETVKPLTADKVEIPA